MKQRDLVKKLQSIGFEFYRHGGKGMRVAYPVIFTDVGTNILIEVPDLALLTEANSEGTAKANLADAIMMARDAIGTKCIYLEDEGREISEPSFCSDIDITKGQFYGEGRSIVSMVDVDLIEYRRSIDNKSIRRNVSIPNWLNREAEKAHINVSKTLQEALKKELHIA